MRRLTAVLGVSATVVSLEAYAVTSHRPHLWTAVACAAFTCALVVTP